MHAVTQTISAVCGNAAGIFVFGLVGMAWVSVGAVWALMTVVSPPAAAALIGLIFLLAAAVLAVRLRSGLARLPAPGTSDQEAPARSSKEEIIGTLADQAEQRPMTALGLALAAGFATAKLSDRS